MIYDTAEQIIKRQEDIQVTRSTFEMYWDKIARVLLPASDIFFRKNTPQGERRDQDVITTVPQMALHRWSAYFDSVNTPASQVWHTMVPKDKKYRENQAVMEYLKEQNDILWEERYGSESNFMTQNHEVSLSLGAFGTGVMIVEDTQTSISYTSSHISEHFFVKNAQGIIDTNYRRYSLSAHQAMQKFGPDLPAQIVKAAEKNPDQLFEFIHCVKPNPSVDPNAYGYKSNKFISYHVSVEGAKILSIGGFRTFPFMISRYMVVAGETWGRGLGMTALPEILQVNSVKKTHLRAAHMAVDAPILTSSEIGLKNPVLKPSSLIYGGLDVNGNPLVKPYLTQSRIDISNDTIAQSYQIINEAFMLNLFQIMQENPNQTATEALLRDKERAALVSPMIGRNQSEYLKPLLEREVDILAFQGKIFADPPDEMFDENGYLIEYKIEFTAPLNLMAKASEALALQRFIELSIPLIQLDPDARNRIDIMKAMNVYAESLGVSPQVLRSIEETQKINAALAEAEAQQQMINNAPMVASSVRDIAEAQNAGV